MFPLEDYRWGVNVGEPISLACNNIYFLAFLLSEQSPFIILDVTITSMPYTHYYSIQSGLRCGTPYTFTVMAKSGYEWSDGAIIHTITGN